MEITTKLANNFASHGGVGEKLQKLLEERAAKVDNWVSGYIICKLLLAIKFVCIIVWNIILYTDG